MDTWPNKQITRTVTQHGRTMGLCNPMKGKFARTKGKHLPIWDKRRVALASVRSHSLP